MDTFRFLHAADLHLDSPLLGLTAKSPDFADAVERASRRAFDNLLELAIAQDCRFVVLAGDIFDGDLRDVRAGLSFIAGMERLRRRGIDVFLILGNHDAENRFAPRLDYAGVRRFGHHAPATVVIEDVGVAVHGQSFDRRDVGENLARNYPPPASGRFNIGVLHTACEGLEGSHDRYAPCSLEQLVNHGYHYWALGHVHARAVLNEHPHVVYPGNLQGRSVRETGPKGATVVEVAAHEIVACRHHDLDEVRWAAEVADVTGALRREDVLDALRDRGGAAAGAAGGRPVALRLRLEGATPLHADLLLDAAGLREDVEAALAASAPDVWLERLEVATRAPDEAETMDATVSGLLAAEVRRMAGSEEAQALLEACLAEIRVKMPAAARTDALFGRLRDEGPGRAAAIALSLVAGTGDADH